METEELFRNGMDAGWPSVTMPDGSTVSGGAAWARAVENPRTAAVLRQHLAEQNETFLKECEAEERRRRPLDFDDPNDFEAQASRQMRDDAAERARARELPATRGQLDELLSIMREVRDALTGRS